jgi:sugar lactone lactonase YvrE
MSITAQVERVWPAGAVLGEGPTWDARSRALYWVDIKGGLLHAYAPASGDKSTWRPAHRVFSLDTPPRGWSAPAGPRAHWFIGCTAKGFGWIGIEGESVVFHPLAHPEHDHPQNRYNDGKAGPDGRYWAGSMHDGESEASGRLYAFTPDGGVARLDEGYVVSNGPAFSPSGRVVYHTDSAARRIYRFDLSDDGQLANREVFRQFSADDGYPDGMTTDAAGNIWVAMWDGACIRQLSPRGADLTRIALPPMRPTSCAFADAQTLFVTSARVGLATPSEDDGALFRISLR